MSEQITGAEMKEIALKSHSRFSRLLNKYFHHIDRGGTLSNEITAGISISILSICGIFLNMQLVAKMSVSGSYTGASSSQIAANGEIYANMYFAAMLIAFIGSLMIGLIARLPLVQVSSLGLSTVLISMIGTEKGLTYYNLLVITFFSSILYALLVSVPMVKKWVFQAIPASVRKALPASVGLLLAFVALQLTGIITVGGSLVSVYGAGSQLDYVGDTVSLANLVSFGKFSYSTDKFHPLLLISALAVIITFICYLIYKRFSKYPYFFSLLTGTGFFLVFSISGVAVNWNNFHFSFDSLWGRIWMIGGEDAMQAHISRILDNLSVGKIFSEGMDFSAYTANGGSVVMLFTAGLLTFLFMSMYDAQAALSVTAASSRAFDANNQKDLQRALMCNAGINIVAPLLGAAPVAIGKESYAGTEDGAKSGLASVSASVLFFISMFVWLIPAVFATACSYDIAFNMYGHYGTVMQLLTECSFGVADAVMVILGLSMIKHSIGIEGKDYAEYVPFIVTIAGTFFLSSLAYGVALGTVAFIIIQLTKIKKAVKGKMPEALTEIGIPTAVMGLLSAVLLISAALLI